MNEVEQFVDTLFTGLDGFVYGAQKHPMKKDWLQRFFVWPDERDNIIEWVIQYHKILDIYLAPSVFKSKHATKDAWKDTNFVWTEIDRPGFAPNWQSLPPPSILVQSSTFGNFHAYWRVPRGMDRETVEGYNRRLCHLLDGADSTGWDCTQVLRPPNTINHKPNKLAPVRLLYLADNGILSLDPSEIALVPEPVMIPDTMPNPADVFQKYFTDSTSVEFLAQGMEIGRRSTALMRLAYTLAALQASPEEIFSVVLATDNSQIHKFSGRSDQMKRIQEIVTIAITKLPPKPIDIDWQETKEVPVISMFLTPDEILHHTPDIHFLWEDFLIECGLTMLVGPPGVGKTQWSYFVLSHMVLGFPILDKPFHFDGNIGYLSLEMAAPGMKYIIQGQRGFWTPNQWKVINERLRTWPVGEIVDFTQSENRKKVEEAIEVYGFRGLAIDTLSTTTFNTLSDEQVAKQLFAWFDYLRKKYDLFIWLNHHNRKAQQSGFNPIGIDDIHGARYIQGQIDTIFTMQETDKKKLELSILKARYSAMKDQVFELPRGENLSFGHQLKAIGPSSKSPIIDDKFGIGPS